jgi:hypothetical protein
MPELPGYRPIPHDPLRRVVTPSGETISRRQYQKLQHGGVTPEQAAKQAKAEKPRTAQEERREKFGYTSKTDYADKLDAFTKHWNATHPGDQITRREAMGRNEFKYAYGIHSRQRDRKRPDRSPTGEWAQALVDMGLREPEWDWAVGETPPTGKSARAA